MTPLVVGLILSAALLHATWNAILRGGADRLWSITVMCAVSAVVALPFVFFLPPPSRASWPCIALSAALQVSYCLFLVRAYREGGLAQVYPIARGTSPLVVAFGAYLLAGEHLGAAPLAGVAILAAGLASLALSSGRLTSSELPAIGAALFTGLTIAAYTIVDGLGVRRSGDPYAYAGLLFLLMGPVFPVIAAFRRPRSWLTAPGTGKGLLAGALSLIAYGIVLWAQTKAPLAEVAAIRETGVVFAALIGMKLFGESFGARRLAAALLVAAGIVLISL
jgi:drug/metabolite transporter (DMT)-like permease